MKRLTIALITLLLTACAPPTYTELISAAYAPVTDDPATDLDSYIIVGQTPTGLPFPVPPRADVLGTWAPFADFVVVYMQASPAVFDFYQGLEGYHTLNGGEDHLELCREGARLTVIEQEGLIQANYRPSDAPCLTERPSPSAGNLASFLPIQPGDGPSRRDNWDATASQTMLLAREGRTLDELTADITQQTEAAGWQLVGSRTTAEGAWLTWEKSEEEVGLLALDTVITLQTEGSALLAMAVQVLP